MLTRTCLVALVVAGTCLLSAGARAADDANLKKGTPQLKSAGPMAFAPDGVLLIGDTQQAAIFAIATGDAAGNPNEVEINVDAINEKVASALGTSARQIAINDVVVNPASGNVYLSVERGQGNEAMPVVLRVNKSGAISEVSLKDVPFAMASIPNAPAPGGEGRQNRRAQSITDIAYVDGRVIVAGLSNEEFASKLNSIPYPFASQIDSTSVEIYHGNHGGFETRSPVRTFVPFEIGGQPHLVAGYTCTPLVKFPLSDLEPGKKVMGTTIAELGNRNNPLDMVAYKQGGKDYILIANSARGMMKVDTAGIDKEEGITERVAGIAGLSYDTIESLQGVVQLDRLNDDNAIVLVQTDSGAQNLQTIPLP